MNRVEISAKTVEEAIAQGLKQLGTSAEEVHIDIIEQPSRGLFGWIGVKDAKVILTLNEKQQDAVAADTSTAVLHKVVAETGDAQSGAPREEVVGLELGKQFLKDVLSSMNIQAEIVEKQEDEYTVLQIQGSKLGLIIGRRGQTLDSLQYLVNVVINRKQRQHVKVLLDAENYRERRQVTLEALADRLAARAIKTKRDVVLEPMNPAERKIIHSKLQDHPQVATHSTGDEPHRKVVISLRKG